MSDTKKKFNPKVGNGFSNDKFGTGSIIVKVDKEGFDAVMKNLQVDSSILLKFNKQTSTGNNHYFCEILPPFTGNKKAVAKATASDLD